MAAVQVDSKRQPVDSSTEHKIRRWSKSDNVSLSGLLQRITLDDMKRGSRCNWKQVTLSILSQHARSNRKKHDRDSGQAGKPWNFQKGVAGNRCPRIKGRTTHPFSTESCVEIFNPLVSAKRDRLYCGCDNPKQYMEGIPSCENQIGGFGNGSEFSFS